MLAALTLVSIYDLDGHHVPRAPVHRAVHHTEGAPEGQIIGARWVGKEAIGPRMR